MEYCWNTSGDHFLSQFGIHLCDYVHFDTNPMESPAFLVNPWIHNFCLVRFVIWFSVVEVPFCLLSIDYITILDACIIPFLSSISGICLIQIPSHICSVEISQIFARFFEKKNEKILQSPHLHVSLFLLPQQQPPIHRCSTAESLGTAWQEEVVAAWAANRKGPTREPMVNLPSGNLI